METIEQKSVKGIILCIYSDIADDETEFLFAVKKYGEKASRKR
jgi:hypothetical protein